MSIPPEALQKVLGEIEARAQFSQQQLQIVKTQQLAKQRDQRLLDLTWKELETLGPDAKLYEGVGKMFVAETPATVKERIETERKGLESDVKALDKKYVYLDTTFQKAKEHMDAILQRGR